MTRSTALADNADGEPESARALGRRLTDARFTYHLVAAATVAPILVAAVRDGLNGWVPAFDAANFVMSSRFSLGLHPSLVGIYSDASRWAGAPTFFPGPWSLWWMAMPIRILGPCWGPLLAMAVLQVGSILLAGWCVRRRLGPRAAMTALVFLGALTWALGTSALHSPVGQLMVVPMVAAFCFVAWALAAGDEGVLWAFALVTNFIILDEVVVVRLVPVIAAVALGLWLVGLARARRSDPDGWPLLRKRTLRAALLAGAVTTVMWIPPIVQQITNDPGNLTNLWRAATNGPPIASIPGRAYEVLISLFAVPPFWLRGSRASNQLIYTPPPATVLIVVTTMALAVLFVGLTVAAARRRDRQTLSLLTLGAVAFFAQWFNLAHPPDPTGMPTFVGYFLSTWAVAMFVTFALVWALVRSLPAGFSRVGVPAVGACAVILGLANLPHANFTDGTYASDDDLVSTARSFDDAIEHAVGPGDRVTFARTDIYGTPYALSAAVRLQDAGVPFCFDGYVEWSALPIPTCRDGFGDVTIAIGRDNRAGPDPGGTVIARHDPLSASERRELARLSGKVRAAMAAAPELHVTDEFREAVTSTIPPGSLRQAALSPSVLDTAGDPLSSRDGGATFASWIDVATHLFSSDGKPPVHVRGLADDDLARWAALETDRSYETFTVRATRHG